MKTKIIIFLIIFLVYFFSGRKQNTQHHFYVPLADAFLHKRLYVDKMTFTLHEMISEEEIKTEEYKDYIDGTKGKYYVIYPPLPAVMLMPFVAIWGWQTNQSFFTQLIAGLSGVLAYLVFREMKLSKQKALWLTLLFSFGSSVWYHAVVGSAWYLALICSIFFLWLTIWATLKKLNMFLIGTFLGLAYLCRYPAILSLPFFLLINSKEWFKNKKIYVKPILLFFSGLGLLVIISFIYNYLRFGTIWHLGYQLLERRYYNINNEYQLGSYSLSYFPRHLKAMFWSFPNLKNQFPYIIPNMWSMALWFVMPAIILIFWVPFKKRMVWLSWLAIFLISIASLFHGGIGATQFGYRYAMDYFPFLFILIAEAVRKKFYWWQKSLILLSVLINIWGIYCNFWIK